MSLRILVTGSRDWSDRTVIHGALIKALEWSTIGTPVLVHGAARGADTLAAEVWEWLGKSVPGGLAVDPHPAKWRLYGKAAGSMRNQHMVSLGADICLTFALPQSVGTFDCAGRARKAGIRVVDYGIPTTAEVQETLPW